MAYEQMRVLITVKAYPQLGQKTGETVCVAGARLDRSEPSWVRLFPVAFRELPREDQFRKYDIVSLRAKRASQDVRPESHTPDLQSLEVIEHVSTKNAWSRRWDLLEPLVGATTACRLVADAVSRGTQAPSLGLIKPVVHNLTILPNTGFNDDKTQLAWLLSQGTLLTEQRTPLEPAPYVLRFHYSCEDPGCPGHDHAFIDWEAGAAALRWRQDGASADTLPGLLRKKFLDQVCGPDRDTYFFLGNVHRFPETFMVLGAFWPPAGSEPMGSLF